MDLGKTTVNLCVLGTQAEFERRFSDARSLYAEAWNCATDDYEKCIAAHYVAHLESDADEALKCNLLALAHAELAEPALISGFLPSLYVNLGHSYELTGDAVQSIHYYELAAKHGLLHEPRINEVITIKRRVEQRQP